jgi:hypothetical protein
LCNSIRITNSFLVHTHPKLLPELENKFFRRFLFFIKYFLDVYSYSDYFRITVVDVFHLYSQYSNKIPPSVPVTLTEFEKLLGSFWWSVSVNLDFL